MTPEMIEWYAQSNSRSRDEGKAKRSREIAESMISDGADDAYVSRMTGLDIETVKEMRISMCA